MEDEITEHFLQTVASKVKVWRTPVSTEYLQTVGQALHSRVLIWKGCNHSLIFSPVPSSALSKAIY